MNPTFYLVINNEQTENLSVVETTLHYFSNYFQREPKHIQYEMIHNFFLHGLYVYIVGLKEEVINIQNHLSANNIKSQIINDDEFKILVETSKQKYLKGEKIKIIFGDQEFDASSNIKEIEVIEDIDEYVVKMPNK